MCDYQSVLIFYQLMPIYNTEGFYVWNLVKKRSLLMTNKIFSINPQNNKCLIEEPITYELSINFQGVFFWDGQVFSHSLFSLKGNDLRFIYALICKTNSMKEHGDVICSFLWIFRSIRYVPVLHSAPKETC